eukprot:gene1668-1033_t
MLFVFHMPPGACCYRSFVFSFAAANCRDHDRGVASEVVSYSKNSMFNPFLDLNDIYFSRDSIQHTSSTHPTQPEALPKEVGQTAGLCMGTAMNGRPTGRRGSVRYIEGEKAKQLRHEQSQHYMKHKKEEQLQEEQGAFEHHIMCRWGGRRQSIFTPSLSSSHTTGATPSSTGCRQSSGNSIQNEQTNPMYIYIYIYIYIYR